MVLTLLPERFYLKKVCTTPPEIVRALFVVLEATAPVHTPQYDTHRNAGKPWTSIKDEKLKDEFIDKISISDIAKEHGRTYRAIESRLDHP
jgi:hypothetical protein